MRSLSAFIAFLIALVAPVTASATVLPLNGGWQADTVVANNVASVASPWTFTLTGPAIFRLTDSGIAGDTFWIMDGATLVTISEFGAKPSLGGATLYDANWQIGTYAKIELLLGAGSYSWSVYTDGAQGLPAAFAVRLDAVAVPETGTWAMMILGFGMAGGAMRRRSLRTRVSFAA